MLEIKATGAIGCEKGHFRNALKEHLRHVRKWRELSERGVAMSASSLMTSA